MTRSRILALATVLLLLGFVELVVGLVRAELIQLAAADLAALTVGWATFVELLGAAATVLTHASLVAGLKLNGVPEALVDGQTHLVVGALAWVAGWVLLALTLKGERAVPQLSPAAGKLLHPRLAQYVDFHWGTLAAYGFGFLLSELVFIGLYLAVVGKGTVQGGVVQDGLSPVIAFVVSFLVAMGVAFGGGFVGAANSKRLSTPEATLALLYFGLPVPVLLTVMHQVPRLMIELGIKLRELIYLSSLLGENRPELGYWLVTMALGLGFFLGINLGFVSTSSGRLDLRTSYELFIASRHVAVFRPKLLLKVFGVLILGIVPPLILWAIISAAEKVVERTRVKKLGQRDPLDAAEALNQIKLDEPTPTATDDGDLGRRRGCRRDGPHHRALGDERLRGRPAEEDPRYQLARRGHEVLARDARVRRRAPEGGRRARHRRRDTVHLERGDDLVGRQHLGLDDQGHRPRHRGPGDRPAGVPGARRQAGVARRSHPDQPSPHRSLRRARLRWEARVPR